MQLSLRARHTDDDLNLEYRHAVASHDMHVLVTANIAALPLLTPAFARIRFSFAFAWPAKSVSQLVSQRSSTLRATPRSNGSKMGSNLKIPRAQL